MKYSIASAAALLQLAAAQHFTNSSTPVTGPTTTTSVGTTSFWTSTVKPTGVTTITEVVDTVVTYCPAPTTLTLGAGKTYTVTAPGTVTIKDCPCTLSKAVSTEVVTAYTTYCPAPTTITQGTQKYTMTAPGVATITNCPCTLTHPISTPAPTSPAQQAPPAPPAAPVPAPPAGNSCPACPSCPAVQTVTVTVGSNGVPVAPSGPAPSGPAPSGPAPSGPAPSGPAPSGPAPTGPAPGTTVVPPPVGPTTVVPPVSPTTSIPAPPKNTSVPSTCPLTLAGSTYQYPHLIVEAPVPSGPFSATSYNATITPGQSAYLNFDIPASYAGKTCDIIFALPTQGQLQTSSFSLSGSGAINFGRLSAPAVTGQSSRNTTVTELGSWSPVPGNAFTVATNACKAGSTVGYKISSSTRSLEYFQDYNPCPIGLYVVAH